VPIFRKRFISGGHFLHYSLHLLFAADSGVKEPLVAGILRDEDLDPADPFRGMARAYSRLFICRSDDQKERYIQEMVAAYKVDGIIFHDSKTCPNNSNNRYQMPHRLQAKLGKPYLVIQGDLNDLRLYSEEQTRTNIQAFVEQLAQR
jgi:benzoyl-CoA reductase/2-hydroxyglutaryl-CoA dehydratase subunit BcrC/BadD/HgdB